MLWKLLDPRRGWVAFTFFSHKILRWFCPFFLLGLLASNLALSGSPFYRGLLYAQLGFYSLFLLAAFVPVRYRFLKPLRLGTMFISMNVALLVGFCRWLWGARGGSWSRTERPARAEGVVP
jgi:hypothetical protein